MEQDIITITNKSMDDIISRFESQFKPSEEYSNIFDTTKIFVVEKYYFRIESNLAATVIFDEINENEVKVIVIVAGGKQGSLDLSWGSEKSMLKNIMDYFRAM
ncbi:MAG: hypothetical protein GF317_20990 [Candidatus Lokiarchaeota archaeon]|nr:hypothetical protein [Candidatus Lokiarchaeota archaeon]MBD3201921.1 hypothetical protein [Candidatus Lokiarchaeota archaeon]